MTARALQPTTANIQACAAALRRGELVAMPTETVYGLAGLALNPEALARSFATKDRPTFDPLLVHVALDLSVPRLAQLADLVDIAQLSPHAQMLTERLLQAFWPGPLTLVLPRTDAVPDLATSGLPTVAVRMPRHPVALALLAAVGVPLAAPSANRFGRISPTSAQDVLAELGDRLDLVLDGGPCAIGVESTVLAMELDGTMRLLRPGGVAHAEIERVAEQAVLAAGTGPIAAPGMLASHYAPRKPLRMLPVSVNQLDSSTWRQAGVPAQVQHIGLLVMAGDPDQAADRLAQLANVRVEAVALSSAGDPSEIARYLFSGLRALDASEAQFLVAEPCPSETGLWHAIADRLRRASHDSR